MTLQEWESEWWGRLTPGQVRYFCRRPDPGDFRDREKILWYADRGADEDPKTWAKQNQRTWLWHEMTVKRGFFRECRRAVGRGEERSLRGWLEENDKQEILRFRGDASYRLFRAHLLCAGAARRTCPTGASEREFLASIVQETGWPEGFLRDLVQELSPEGARRPLRRADGEHRLAVLLVGGLRDEGVVANLVLERMPDGSGALYLAPALAFVERDEKFLDAEACACACVGLQEAGQDVRWRLERRDLRPLIRLEGDSMGAALALGLAKLLGI